MSASHSFVLIIVERADREFIPKLLWKEEFDSRGILCFMATRQFAKVAILISNLFAIKAIIIDKSAQFYHLEYLQKLKQKGNYIVIAEEEAWVPFDIEDFFVRRLPSKAQTVIDELWIPFNAIIKSYIPKNYSCFVINHPRTLITHSEYMKINSKNNSIASSKSTDILFISSFGLLSSDIDFLKIMSLECETLNISKYTEILHELKTRFYHFVNVINETACYASTYNIKIRMHPSEIGVWENIKLPKQVLFDDTDYIESISTAGVVIHSGSTVAFDVPEGFLQKVIYISPKKSEYYTFPKQVSGHSIEGSPEKTAAKIIEIHQKIKNIKFSYSVKSDNVAIIPKSKIIMDLIPTSRHLRFFLNLSFHLISVLIDFFNYVNLFASDREIQKINSFATLRGVHSNKKRNYHV